MPSLPMRSRTISSRPTRIARPSPEFWNEAAARITGSSSPSANTMRFGFARTLAVMLWNRPADGSSRAESWNP